MKSIFLQIRYNPYPEVVQNVISSDSIGSRDRTSPGKLAGRRIHAATSIPCTDTETVGVAPCGRNFHFAFTLDSCIALIQGDNVITTHADTVCRWCLDKQCQSNQIAKRVSAKPQISSNVIGRFWYITVICRNVNYQCQILATWACNLITCK